MFRFEAIRALFQALAAVKRFVGCRKPLIEMLLHPGFAGALFGADVLEFFASAIAPIDCTGCSSNRAVIVPLSSDFQTAAGCADKDREFAGGFTGCGIEVTATCSVVAEPMMRAGGGPEMVAEL
jgi:hypothetical protein